MLNRLLFLGRPDEPGGYDLGYEAMELYKHCEAMVRRRSKP